MQLLEAERFHSACLGSYKLQAVWSLNMMKFDLRILRHCGQPIRYGIEIRRNSPTIVALQWISQLSCPWMHMRHSTFAVFEVCWTPRSSEHSNSKEVSFLSRFTARCWWKLHALLRQYWTIETKLDDATLVYPTNLSDVPKLPSAIHIGMFKNFQCNQHRQILPNNFFTHLYTIEESRSIALYRQMYVIVVDHCVP